MRVGDTVRFSILMPVFDEGKHLQEAIDSVLQQTFTDFELIVIDDGSSDNSVELIKATNPESNFCNNLGRAQRSHAHNGAP